MTLTRRQLMVIAAAIAAGCNRSDDHRRAEHKQGSGAPSSKPTDPTTRENEAFDAGAIANFPPESVSDAFRSDGLFVIHRDKKLFALASTCTHKGCKVRLAPDQSFYCKCHGSTFDREGKVTKGPATRDLHRLSVAPDERNHVLVRM
jgi:Rieske Fe-S protein